MRGADRGTIAEYSTVHGNGAPVCGGGRRCRALRFIVGWMIPLFTQRLVGPSVNSDSAQLYYIYKAEYEIEISTISPAAMARCIIVQREEKNTLY